MTRREPPQEIRPTVIHIEYIALNQDELVIEGFTANTKEKLTVFCNGCSIKVSTVDRNPSEISQHYKETEAIQGFSIRQKIDSIRTIKLLVDESDIHEKVVLHRFTHLDNRKHAYRTIRDRILQYQGQGLFIVKTHTYSRTIWREAVYCLRLIGYLKLDVWKKEFAIMRVEGIRRYSSRRGVAYTINMFLLPLRSIIVNISIILFRISYFVLKNFTKRRIWLISDRVNMAGDNGEAFLRYVMKHARYEITPYFILRHDSPDYERICSIIPAHRIISPTSYRYKLLMLLSDKVISSQANEIVINAFGARQMNVIDLYTYDFIFLQHGLIKDDLSTWLNRYNRDIQMFVTSAKPEYESIINGQYYYDNRVVRLTGQPRYDLLKNSPSDKLIIMPTWREDLVLPLDISTGLRAHNPDFKKSDYFTFFDNLLNHKLLTQYLSDCNMTAEVYFHPAMEVQIKDFTSSGSVRIMKPPYNYSQAFSEGNILLTDYSSAAFDFAYLMKPIIYAQFDRDTFYEGHTYEPGYYNYDKDGLGKVTTSVDDTVSAIIEVIENGCQLSDNYRRRIEGFFGAIDNKNCKRVYDDIMDINRRFGRR